jgi:hypothetical protein
MAADVFNPARFSRMEKEVCWVGPFISNFMPIHSIFTDGVRKLRAPSNSLSV